MEVFLHLHFPQTWTKFGLGELTYDGFFGIRMMLNLKRISSDCDLGQKKGEVHPITRPKLLHWNFVWDTNWILRQKVPEPNCFKKAGIVCFISLPHQKVSWSVLYQDLLLKCQNFFLKISAIMWENFMTHKNDLNRLLPFASSAVLSVRQRNVTLSRFPKSIGQVGWPLQTWYCTNHRTMKSNTEMMNGITILNADLIFFLEVWASVHHYYNGPQFVRNRNSWEGIEGCLWCLEGRQTTFLN